MDVDVVCTKVVVGGVDTSMIRTLLQRKCTVHAEAERNLVIVLVILLQISIYIHCAPLKQSYSPLILICCYHSTCSLRMASEYISGKWQNVQYGGTIH